MSKLKKFERFCALIGLTLEPFQKLALTEYFDGRKELLILIPRGNGKTSLLGALALFHLLSTPDAKVYIGASAAKQAKLMFEAARDLSRKHPHIKKRVQVRLHELRCPQTNGFIRVLSSDGERAQGLVDPSLLLVDELHAHKNPDLYLAMRLALHKRDICQLLTISTAGFDRSSQLSRMRLGALELDDIERHEDQRLTIAKDPEADFAMFEWACREDDDLESAAVIKLANPASFVTEKDIERDLAAVRMGSIFHLEFIRYRANVWTRSQDSWIPMGSWEKLYEEGADIPDGSEVWLGIDVGLRDDTTALITLWKRPDGKTVIKSKVLEPPGDGTSLDPGLVEEHIKATAARYKLKRVVYDNWGMTWLATELANRGLLMVALPQSSKRLVTATSVLNQAIRQGELVHDGDRELTNHVYAGALRPNDHGLRLDKGRAKEKIDALMALACVYSEMYRVTNTPSGMDRLYAMKDKLAKEAASKEDAPSP